LENSFENGMVECWNGGIMREMIVAMREFKPNIPIFHPSIIPIV
jgi:hypothetical protein